MKIWRVNLVLVMFLIWSALIIGRLVYIQLFNYQYWRAFAQGQQKFFTSLEGERGKIMFRDKTLLALDNNFFLVYVIPSEIKDKEAVIRELSRILKLEQDFVRDKVKSNDNSYVPMKRKLLQEEVEELLKLELKGVYVIKELGRYYPLKDVAAQTIGFVGGERKGQYGIEGFYDDILKGNETIVEKEKGLEGYFFTAFGDFNFRGSDIILTLDYNIQTEAERLLDKAKEDFNIEKGEIIVIDPNTGEIIALANFPRFDLNNYSSVEDIELFRNSSFQEIFEPGSVMKAVTMAAALDQHKITPETEYTDVGYVKIGGYTIQNYGKRVWGKQTMSGVLERSINTGAIFAQRQIGGDVFLDYLKKFGFFEPTKVDLQGEVFSQNKELKKGYEVNFATASFGQGIEVTSLQLVRAFSVIANKGKLIRPFIVKEISGQNGVIEKKPVIGNNEVISQEAASQVTSMLVNVVEKALSKRAKVEGYYLAGKTGTAQVPYKDKRGYYPDRTIQSFIGFGPALNPKFVILVKLYNPSVNTAEYSAAPIFRELAKYILDYWKIPPDY